MVSECPSLCFDSTHLFAHLPFLFSLFILSLIFIAAYLLFMRFSSASLSTVLPSDSHINLQSGLTSDTEMAGVFATQHLEKVYGSERQARVLPTEHAQSEIDNVLLDPMDTSSIKSSPAQQPETNAQSVGSNPPQNHVQSYSHLGPSFSNEMPRYVATIDDPYPWGPSLNSPFVRPRFAFSPKSRAASRIKSNPIAIAKPSANRTKQISFAARNGSTLTGFNHTTRPFWNNRLVNDTSLLSSGVPSVANRGLAWTNFQKINMPSQGHPLKSDRSASVLSGFSSLPRKRSIDEDATSNPPQKVIDDSSNIFIAPSAKYRRVDQKGSRLSPILPNVTAPDMAAGPQMGMAAARPILNLHLRIVAMAICLFILATPTHPLPRHPRTKR